ncbi:MAG TPA: ferredoxin reductase family protein [Baekduia sp.]|uniref:ferredoxin reductase family protein n=1 Tax=Baekduia sp. TaxID=2600305 RepID=UPI002BF963A8|nr:ferredoxin reductase family protein [Baekduia sp.]HMJ37778.1 ferredoxin reductase family protein [Baekduia sp.]
MSELAYERRVPRRVTGLGAGDLWLLFVANIAVIGGLWFRGGALNGVADPGTALISAGRLTGLVGTYLALVQILLVARLPWLERLAGFDTLTLWHRRNGKLCLSLLLAHTVLITAGYTLSGRTSLLHEISKLLTSYDDMITATIGMALLIVVVATSVVVVRRRLPYEAWHAVHLTTYAAMALAFAHQLSNGTEFSADPLAKNYWRVLYLVTLGAIVAFRLLVPLGRTLWHGMRVEAVVPEGLGVVSLHISGRRLDRLGARSGQFFLWRFLTSDGWWQSHPFSLSAPPTADRLRVTVKNLGDFSARAALLRPGTRVIAEGPFGTLTEAVRTRRRVLLVAGGVGITPLRALFEDLPAGPGDLTLIYRAVDAPDVVFRGELDALAARRDAAVHYVLGDHRDPHNRGLLGPTHLRGLVPDVRARDVYVCGPPAMTAVTGDTLRELRVPRRHIHVERFAW